MKDFRQLFPTKTGEDIAALSCDHVIPKESLLTQVVTLGPSKKPMEFKFDSRNDDGLVVGGFIEEDGETAESSADVTDSRAGRTHLECNQPDPRRGRGLFAIICFPRSGQIHLAAERFVGQARCAEESKD